MKKYIFLIVLLPLFSCNKEKNSLKEFYGSYSSSEFVVYEDSNYVVTSDIMGINEVGVGLSYSLDGSTPGCEFDYEKSDSHLYDYKLTFKRTRLFFLNLSTGEMVEQPSPSESELNAGRTFYLSKTADENTMLFSVVYDNGSTDVHTFTK